MMLVATGKVEGKVAPALQLRGGVPIVASPAASTERHALHSLPSAFAGPALACVLCVVPAI